MSAFITHPDQIDADWLTAALRSSGALVEGKVTAISRDLFDTNTANACQLMLDYSPDAAGSLPRTLFFKLGRRISEVHFYQAISPKLTDVPTVRCYHAAFANELGQSNLLFEDISKTHRESDDHPNVPPETMRHMITTLAVLHRQWWEHPDLRMGGALHAKLDDVPAFIHGQAAAKLAEFKNTVGDAMPVQHLAWLEQAITGWPHPAWQERLTQHQGVTLVHGDAHYWNFAYPIDPADPLYLMDWAVWHLNLPAFDLAYLIAMNTERDQARKLEAEMLPIYHDVLNIAGYGRDQLLHDYRLSIILQTFWLVFWHGWMDEKLWSACERNLMGAFEDHDCAALL